MPSNGLVGIAMEGLAPEDQKEVSAPTVQIADVTLYSGKHPNFTSARSVNIVQLKYSVSGAKKPLRAADAQKTIQKFADAYRDHKRKYGTKEIQQKLTFELVSNRPVSNAFVEALSGLSLRKRLIGDAKRQAEQFMAASRLAGNDLRGFAQKFKLTGSVGSLKQRNQELSRVIADWSATHDAIARARLGDIRQLLREKAGAKGEGQNLITRVDVLERLGLSAIEDLFPCEAVFPSVGAIVPRAQLASTIRLISQLERPLLIHADGGVGKTVFLQSLSIALSKEHEVILFDCFGGGAYRAPDDTRHLPSRGLIHIVNSLACKGFCDPLLPLNENVADLMRAFRNRLSQVVTTLQRTDPRKLLLLFIDAIDNAAEQAKDKGQQSFATLIMESLQHNGPIPGVKIIVSCRTHRRAISRNGVLCEELELQPFNLKETEAYLRNRIAGVTDSQVQVAFSRSGGNPRILEHLALSDRGLLEASEVNVQIKLNDLLEDRIQRALGDAERRGYTKSSIEAFLAGLAVLPPPVPISEYANAHDIEVGAVESFAADLAPLLERTKYGLMFRDEPTETFVRENYAAKKSTLRKLAYNLFEKQGSSVYAASALPGLLTKLDDSGKLFKLAFDVRFPQAISTAVGQQHIRYNRLTAAVLHASRKNDAGRLVQLLVELSSLAAVNQRGTAHLIDNPDLVINSGDVDATRRLFETRTPWPGTRHSRLAIAATLTGDIGEATRHAIAAEEWIGHFNRQQDEQRRRDQRPEKLDIASIALCLAAQNRPKIAVKFMAQYFDWAAFEIGEHLFRLLDQAIMTQSVPSICLSGLLTELNFEIGVLASAISFMELDGPNQRRLVKRLSRACAKSKSIKFGSDSWEGGRYQLQHGMLKAAAIALVLGLHKEARAIATAIPDKRPDVSAFSDHFSNRDVSAFLIRAAVIAAADGESINENMVLPGALARIASRVPSTLQGAAYRSAMKTALEKEVKAQRKLPEEKRIFAYEKKAELEAFIDNLLEPLLQITRGLTEGFSARQSEVDNGFSKLLQSWTPQATELSGYRSRRFNSLFDVLGRQFLSFLVWSRKDIAASSVEAFVEQLLQNGRAPTSTITDIVAILSKRPALHHLAGKTAIKAMELVEREDDVNLRASLLADLSRAILPASGEEAASYFRAGLEQMDAIGSGDYQFTNELLWFAASLQGRELKDSDAHTLTNICELNMSDEDKFPWAVFGQALAQISGCRGFAKLARWNDRDKVSFGYSLLPYLNALVENDKIEPTLALAILSLSKPVELNGCGTAHLANAIEKKSPRNLRDLIAALIGNFERNNPEPYMSNTRLQLSEVAKRVLGAKSPEAARLSMSAAHYDKVMDENNDRLNCGSHISSLLKRRPSRQKKLERALNSICRRTRPCDETSICEALAEIDKLVEFYDAKRGFFDEIRRRVRFAEQPQYIALVARIPTLDVYPKIEELKRCKELWGNGSLALNKAFCDLAVPFLEIHVKDFVRHDFFSGHLLKELSDVSGVDLQMLALTMTEILAAKRPNVPAQVWLGLASIICRQNRAGEGQAALRRLLNSGAAKLSSKVVDGQWRSELYLRESPRDITASLIWQSLASPWASARWRAAHAVRLLAEFDKWDVLDTLFAKWNSKHGLPYQAGELPFFSLHAQLWLLIAIARVAIDHPRCVFRYQSILKRVAMEGGTHHVLLRHFASQTLLQCVKDPKNRLSRSEIRKALNVNETLLTSVKGKPSARDGFYQTRPPSLPAPPSEFHLDYDFDKYEVSSVARIFGKSVWEVRDEITNWVRASDEGIRGMYEDGGREAGSRDRFTSMNPEHHGYGQYLGWHGLYEVAGQFLAKYPVTKTEYENEPWKSWFGHHVLTRADGLWLSDGIDRPPLSVQVNLLDAGKGLTYSEQKLLALLGIQTAIANDLVVCGDWRSSDNIGVMVSSALVQPETSEEMARHLAKKDPFGLVYRCWETLPAKKQVKTTKWICQPSITASLDKTDPLGASPAGERARFTPEIASRFCLAAADPFNREWLDGDARIIARAEARGCHKLHEDENSMNGQRLVCSKAFLRRVLATMERELLVLVVLEQHHRGTYGESRECRHTTAIIRVDRSLDFVFYAGASNRPHRMKF